MKNLISIIFILMMSCSNALAQSNKVHLRDGSYQVIKLAADATNLSSLPDGQVVLDFDTLFNPGDHTKVLVDTMDYAPMELETPPGILQQADHKKLLSITLTPEAAEKMKAFTAKRVMKQVVIVLEGRAITTHKIREAITGNKMEITGCSDNAYEHLRIKMNNNVKK